MNALTTIKAKSRNFTTRSRALINKGTMAFCALAATAMLLPGPARAEGDIDDIFAALNLTGLSTNVKTAILSLMVLLVLFVGWKYAKRVANRA